MKPNERKQLYVDAGIWKQIAQQRVDTGRPMHELVAEAWAAYERERTGLSARPSTVESITNQEQSTDIKSSYTREQIQALASEISDRAEELLRITEKVKVPEVNANTKVSRYGKSVSHEEIAQRFKEIQSDTAGLPERITAIEKQHGETESSRKRPDRKISGR